MESTTEGQVFGDERDIEQVECDEDNLCPWCSADVLRVDCNEVVVFNCGSIVQYPAKLQDKLCRIRELEHRVARLQEALHPFAEEGAWMDGRRGVGQNRAGVTFADWIRAGKAATT